MRLIASLDIKNEHVIKGIHLEGLRKVGNPNALARRYYERGIDEIVFMAAVASLYDRNNLFHIVEAACRDVFIPIAVGGGMRSVDDVSKALEVGADKVVINTGAPTDLVPRTAIEDTILLSPPHMGTAEMALIQQTFDENRVAPAEPHPANATATED